MLERKNSDEDSFSQLDENTLIHGLFKFIKKNTIIPKFFDSIKSTDPKINELQSAIGNGNSSASIFKVNNISNDHILFSFAFPTYKTYK